MTRIAVNPAERRMINAVRDLPPGRMRDLLTQVIDRLVALVKEPRCPEMQADGVPCVTPATDCEQCRALKQVLENLREQIPH